MVEISSRATSSHHPGEVHLQEQAGAHERMAKMSEKLVRDHLVEQHRTFFDGLSYLFLGLIDASGIPRAMIVYGPAGFISSPDEYTLRVNVSAITGQTLTALLQVDDFIGVLGLDFSNRRRNRMHGRINRVGTFDFDITVIQSYGNCPKYITTRFLVSDKSGVGKKPVDVRNVLSSGDKQMVENADTFIIASGYLDGSGSRYEGVDVSHRGGVSGFVYIDDDNTLTIPDFAGNNMFNTLGNLIVNPAVALIFIDFENGDEMHLQGSAKLIDTDAHARSFPGALKLLQISIHRIEYRPNALPLRWKAGERSPFTPGLEI